MLKAEEFGITLTSRQYYNIIKNMISIKDDPDTIAGLFFALYNARFVYRTRVEEEVDNLGKIITRKLIQIWFSYLLLLNVCARFVSD